MYRLYEYKSNVQLARKLKPFIERISLSFTTQNNIISALSSPIINICHLCKNTYSNESQITNIQMYEPLYRLSYISIARMYQTLFMLILFHHK